MTKIVKIISTKQLVINAGQKQGIKLGDKFEILDKENGPTITDPDTGQELGTLDIKKGIVEATSVYSNMSIVESPIRTNPFSFTSGVPTQLLKNFEQKSIPEDLNVNPKDISGLNTSKASSLIKIGDFVEKI